MNLKPMAQRVLLFFVTVVCSTTHLAAQSTLDETFTATPTSVNSPPWACSPANPLGHGDWLVLNSRTDFQSNNTNTVELNGSTARLFTNDNSATGGYLALVHPFDEPLECWMMTVRVRVDLAFPARPVPSCIVNLGFSPGEPCNLFPNDNPIGQLGWQASTGQELVLRDGGAPIPTGYTIPANGTWHTVELISTETGSELRAWADGASRPAAALVTGASLGPAQRIHFGGGNFLNFDYSVDSVTLEECEGGPRFQRGDCNDDASFNIADAIYLLGVLFPGTGGGNSLLCASACDANSDATLNIADTIFMLSNLFPGASTPTALAEPLNCGIDPNPPAMPLTCDEECP